MVVLDQHFMIDSDLIKRIVGHSKVKKGEYVVEIGPGDGNLTKALVKKVNVKVIEKDPKFIQELGEIKGVTVIRGDGVSKLPLKFDKLVSNIPYSISEPLFMKLIRCDFELAVLTVSSKFVETLGAGNKLGMVIENFFKIEVLERVPKSSFSPPPKVESAVILVKPKKVPRLIKEFVLQSDKKVFNALVETFCRVKGLTKNEAKGVVIGLKLPDKKVSRLSSKEFGKILEDLKKV